jgi:hypothetical protein
MAAGNSGKDLPGGPPAKGEFMRKPAISGLPAVSMAALATSCPWVIKGLAQNSTFRSPAARDLPAGKPVKAGRRLQ